jgi:hypothetical protein
LERFPGIPIGKAKQLHKQVEHLLKTAFASCIGIIFNKPMT